MRLPAPKILWMLLPATLVVWIFGWERENTLAPPLSLAHAREPELQNSHGCQACHGDWEGTEGMRRACVECHGGIGQDLARGVGLHGAQVDGGVRDCTRCHVEHAGRDFPLVSELSFREAGFPSRSEYDHKGLNLGPRGYALVDAHDGLECAECHEQAETPVLDKGQQRFRGLTQDCVSCHESPHGVQFSNAVECSVCHDQAHFIPAPFGFEAHARTEFSLEGKHKAVACLACHEVPEGQPASARQWSGVSGECASCHLDPHLGLFDGPARPVVVQGQTTCARCHSEESFAKLRVGAAADFDHDFWTDSDTASRHTQQDCDDCHPRILGFRQGDEGLARRGRTRAAAAGRLCADCHEDPHRGQFQAPEPIACDTCHQSQVDFAELDFDHNADSRFALDETHRNVACAACHGSVVWPDGATSVRYKPLGMECVDCHAPGGRETRTAEQRR